MDKHQVYIKTSEGEEAVRQRARLVQRNLRNILIMVDGYSTAAELGDRFGDREVVWKALFELEQAGLIETFERRIVREMNANVPPRAKLPTPGCSAVPSPPRLVASETPTPTSEVETRGSGPSSCPQGHGAALEQGEVDRRTEALLPLDNAAQGARSQLEDGVHASPLELDQTRTRPMAKTGSIRPMAVSRVAVMANGLKAGMTRLKDLIPRRKRRITAARKGRTRLKRAPLKRSGGGVRVATAMLGVIFVAVLAMLPLVPLDGWRSELERQMSKATGANVKIGDLRFAWLPIPGLRAESISVGKPPYGSAASLTIFPDYAALFSGRREIGEMRIHGLEVGQEGISWLGALMAVGRTAEPDPSSLRIGRITADRVRLSAGEVLFEDINGDVRFAPDGSLSSLELRNSPSSFRLSLFPTERNTRIVLAAAGWRMTSSADLLFDKLDAEGTLAGNGLFFSKVEGRLYNGVLEGKGGLDWTNGMALVGEFEIKKLDLAKLLPELGAGLDGAGELALAGRVEGRATRADDLPQALRVAARYVVKQGQINRFDLMEALRSGGPTRGGLTKFDHFSGDLMISQGAYCFSKLNVVSGLMRAWGSVNVAKDKKLDGQMNVEIKGSASLIRMPLLVRGTLAAPRLSPGTS